MQLVEKGPDIPERLLQEHEAGRVVFFCGAGISYPADLPGFKVLVERVRDKLGAQFTPPQQAAFDRGQYDTVLGLLEGTVVGNRERVRRAVAHVLEPNLTLPEALYTHEALLLLSRTRAGRQRIITTNFDRLFEEVKSKASLSYRSYEAPLLPVPKNRWDGVVYLHGVLTEKPDATDLDRLVLSSGDFGLAYLTERWAARFVSELFRSSTVCFVGYSINDPVLRYMMDALSADRLLGESTPEVFALGSYSAKSSNGSKLAEAEWLAKNVTPILYRDDNSHSLLHQTLREWSRIYRDGILGKESIVTRYANAVPMRSTKEDDFTGRLLWALSDEEGLPAKKFAGLEPLPSLEWLEPMSDRRYGHNDLARFGVRPNDKHDEKLKFSMVSRPSPYALSANMRLVGHWGQRDGRLDDVMVWLAVWLARHIDDPKLFLWVTENGPHLHPQFRRHLEKALKSATVRPVMARLWRLILAGRQIDPAHPSDLYTWRDDLLALGYSQSRRLELIGLLSPRVKFSRPSRIAEGGSKQGGRPDASVRDLVKWEIVLVTAHARSALERLQDKEQWAELLVDTLSDFTALLRDALDLMRELDGANDRSDLSYISLPSISEHDQNRGFQDWTLLAELTRDAWLATARIMPQLARAEVARWLGIKYPIFRRLALYAATDLSIFTPLESLDILLRDAWWLWSPETQREAIRLVVTLAPALDAAAAAQLEKEILSGPDRSRFRSDAEAVDELVDREIGLRLSKYQRAGGKLTEAGEARLTQIMGMYAVWRSSEDERDEFPFWMGDESEWGTFRKTPVARSALVVWLKENPRTEIMVRDDWEQRCKSDFPRAVAALLELAGSGNWIADRWRTALQAWTENPLKARSWRRLAQPLAAAPDFFLKEIAHSLSYWLEGQGKCLSSQKDQFFTLARRIIALHKADAVDEYDDILARSINHPIGNAIQAVLNWWRRQNLIDGQELRHEVKEIFSDISNVNVAIYRYGRVLLGANVITLYRVDSAWTGRHVLPLFNWETSTREAVAVWKGFLWTPRLYEPLIVAIRSSFLMTAHHYNALGDYGEQFASLLTYAFLDNPQTFSECQKRNAIGALPDAGLHRAALSLVDAVDGAGEQRSSYWTNRVRPFIETIWPQGVDRRSSGISDAFARIAIASGGAFPEAYEIVRPWLMRSEQPDRFLHDLAGSQQCTKYPEASLSLLDATIAHELPWMADELGRCLIDIKTALPDLETDQRYRRLSNIVKRYG